MNLILSSSTIMGEKGLKLFETASYVYNYNCVMVINICEISINSVIMLINICHSYECTVRTIDRPV